MYRFFPKLRGMPQTQPGSRSLHEKIAAVPKDAITIPSELGFHFHRAEHTRKFCISGLCFAYLVAITAIIWGGCTQRVTQRLANLGNPGVVFQGAGSVTDHVFFLRLTVMSKELAALSVNFIVLFITECLGYIHATSLKWALSREDKLDFNTNLRLFTFSRKSTPNNIFFNIIYFTTLALCYASSPYFVINLFLDPNFQLCATLSRAASLCLGCGLLCQALICTWCLFGWIPTWSSNPINTAAVVLASRENHSDSGAKSLLRDNAVLIKKVPQYLVMKQKSASKTHKHVSWITYTVLAAFGLLLIWMLVLVSFCYILPLYKPLSTFSTVSGGFFIYYHHEDWSFLPSAPGEVIDGQQNFGSSHLIITVFGLWTDQLLAPEVKFLYIILFSTALQIPVTVGTHCVEFLVSLARDETAWRALASKKGASLETTNIRSALTNWQTVVLLIFKPVLHWVYGLVISVDFEFGVFMFAPQAIYLCVFWSVFLAFAIYVNSCRPSGPLPTTYGHIQSIIDLVDEWSPQMFWGDKGLIPHQGPEGQVRHAGTSATPLPPVHMEALYVL